MKSNVNIARHPIHPFLVLLPVGAWVSALVFEIAYLSTRNPLWHDIGYWNILFGVVTALIAAVAGLTDLLTLRMRDEARSVGWTHGLLNVTIVTLFIINLVLRARNDGAYMGTPLTWSFILTAVPVGLLLISGWLGGEMIYRWGVAVPEETIERIPPVTAPRGARITPGVSGVRGGEVPPEEEEHEERL